MLNNLAHRSAWAEECQCVKTIYSSVLILWNNRKIWNFYMYMHRTICKGTCIIITLEIMQDRHSHVDVQCTGTHTCTCTHT